MIPIEVISGNLVSSLLREPVAILISVALRLICSTPYSTSGLCNIGLGSSLVKLQASKQGVRGSSLPEFSIFFLYFFAFVSQNVEM